MERVFHSTARYLVVQCNDVVSSCLTTLVYV